MAKTTRTRSGSRISPVNPGLAAAATTVTETRVTAHAGPLPSPDVLAGYESIVSGAAERIICMAEKQQSSRIDLERRQLEADIEHRSEMVSVQKRAHTGAFVSDYLGQILGFVVAIGALAGGAYAGIVNDDWVVAALFLSLPVLGMVQAVRGMKSKKSDS